MIVYLLKSTLCLLMLFWVYQLLLARTGAFNFNRFFLLFAICFSFTIPLIEINSLKSKVSDETPVISALADAEQQILAFEDLDNYNSAMGASTIDHLVVIETGTLFIYLLVLFILFYRFILNIKKLLNMNRNAQAVDHDGIKLYLLEEHNAPFSFLNRVFIAKEDYIKGVNPKLLIHELAHVQQGHTYDLMFVELIKIVFWFNPLLLLYSKAIRVNHEYLADRTVLDNHKDVGDYQHQLLQYMSVFRSPTLASQLNYSFTKKRFKMMKKKFSKSTAVISISALIPILFIGLMAFSQAVNKIEQSIEAGVDGMESLVVSEVFDEKNVIPSISPIKKTEIERVSSGFGQRLNPSTGKIQPHFGIDLIAETGINVLVTADGKVTVSEFKNGYGNHIKVDHGNGYETLYAHMHELKASIGQSVKMGDVIGSVGNTGKSNGPHLHYEVIKDSKYVDPQKFIPRIDQTKTAQKKPKSDKPWSRYTINGKTYILSNIKRHVLGDKDGDIKQIMLNDSIAVVIYRDNKTVVKTPDEFTELEKTMLNAPPKKPKKVSPTQKQLTDWMDSNKYGIWLDGKRIPNEDLKGYKPDDFSRVSVSGLEKNAKNYGKHEFQVNIYTNEAVKKRWEDKMKAWEEQEKF